MRLVDKIYKSGLLKDRKIEHHLLVAFFNESVLKEFKETGSVIFTFSFFNTPIKIDASMYDDNVIRFIAYSHLDKDNSFELGRILISEKSLDYNLSYLLPIFKEKYL